MVVATNFRTRFFALFVRYAFNVFLYSFSTTSLEASYVYLDPGIYLDMELEIVQDDQIWS